MSIHFWRRRIGRSKSKEREDSLDLEDLLDNETKEKEDKSGLKEKLMKIETEGEECIPKNIRDQIQTQIADWEHKDKMFVSTRASVFVENCLKENSCLTLTAPSGVGKSFIARHTALVLQKDGYKIIPVNKPDDIRNYYQPGKQTVFVVDDICGNFTANQQQIDQWKPLLPTVDMIIADKACKIIVSCRLQVYKDNKFDILLPFKSCECNLMSDKICLTYDEKIILASKYIGLRLDEIDKLSQQSESFPLLCSLYHEEKHKDAIEFFKNPFIVYQNELDSLSRYGDEGNYKICSLALLVLFNNQLKEKWFQGRVTNEQRLIIEDTCEACRLNRGTSKAELREALHTLDGTFVYRQDGIYKSVHDKLFDFLAHYFGHKMIECLIDRGDSDFVHERFIWRKSPDDQTSNIDFVIEIPDDYLESYLTRLIKDWSAGKVSLVFTNNNLQVSSFRQKLLEKITQLDKSKQVSLVNTKDTVIPKEKYGSGNYPLILTCHDGYTDMVKWMIHNEVNVDQCRFDGVNGLMMAKGWGHTDIVKLLLEKNPDVDLCDHDGTSSLLIASKLGYADIVKLLLEKKPKIDSFDNIYFNTPLIMACIKNNTSIVKQLIKHNPDTNAKTFEGKHALYFSALHGNIEITQLLLNNKAGCNIFTFSKTYMINGKLTLQQVKKNCVCSLIDNASSHVADFVNKKSLDYVSDMEANCSPLHIACVMGRKDVVSCLLKYNANINIAKEDGTTPLFYACELGHEDIVHLLLHKGADPQICRTDWKYPLDIATDNERTSIVMVVTEHIQKETQLPL